MALRKPKVKVKPRRIAVLILHDAADWPWFTIERVVAWLEGQAANLRVGESAEYPKRYTSSYESRRGVRERSDAQEL